MTGPATLRPEDLRIDVYRTGVVAGPASCSVRVTHLPTGLVAICSTHRSQLQNRRACLDELEARLDGDPCDA